VKLNKAGLKIFSIRDSGRVADTHALELMRPFSGSCGSKLRQPPSCDLLRVKAILQSVVPLIQPSSVEQKLNGTPKVSTSSVQTLARALHVSPCGCKHPEVPLLMDHLEKSSSNVRVKFLMILVPTHFTKTVCLCAQLSNNQRFFGIFVPESEISNANEIVVIFK